MPVRDGRYAPYLLSLVPLLPDSPLPLHRQLYEGLRQAILQGRLSPGVKLPSSRDLADLFGLSRNTVMNALDQLTAEGYLVPRAGSGTYVTLDLPETYLSLPNELPTAVDPDAPTLTARATEFSRYGAMIRQGPRVPNNAPFTVGIPDLDHFPFHIWSGLVSHYYRTTPPRQAGAVFGATLRLRTVLASHLRSARALRCEPEQILLVSGSQQGMYLAARVLLQPSDQVWVEDPGFHIANHVLRAENVTTIPVPVDAEGFDVAEALRRAPNAAAAYVTPSHQFPLGVTLSLNRRLQLLQWAAENQRWIIEDDFDSEFRYEGQPIASLQGLDRHNRVLYLGTFSNSLFPGLRLGYLVVPPALIDAVIGAAAVIGPTIPNGIADVVAQFIEDGHFTRHLRQMRRHYAEKRDAFLDAHHTYTAGALTLGSTESGLFASAFLTTLTDQEAHRRLRSAGLFAMRLSLLSRQPEPPQGLVMGFASLTIPVIRDAVQRLAAALESGPIPPR